MLLKFCQSVKFHQVLSHYLWFNQTSKSVDNFNRTNYLKQLNKSECKRFFSLKGGSTTCTWRYVGKTIRRETFSDAVAWTHHILVVIKSSGNFALVRGCAIRDSRNCAGRVRVRNGLGQEQGAERDDQRSGIGSADHKVDAESSGMTDWLGTLVGGQLGIFKWCHIPTQIISY